MHFDDDLSLPRRGERYAAISCYTCPKYDRGHKECRASLPANINGHSSWPRHAPDEWCAQHPAFSSDAGGAGAAPVEAKKEEKEPPTEGWEWNPILCGRCGYGVYFSDVRCKCGLIYAGCKLTKSLPIVTPFTNSQKAHCERCGESFSGQSICWECQAYIPLRKYFRGEEPRLK